jgi:autotransporter-associated beta strand protein
MKATIKSTHVPSFGIVLYLLMVFATNSYAGSATWLASPPTGNWNHAANWTPATIPNGPSDTATFASSNATGVSISANTEVNSIVFNAGASAFSITARPTLTLTVSGAGIANNSGVTQNFVAAVGSAGNIGSIVFSNSATAGSLTAFTNYGGTVNPGTGGSTTFRDSSTAGNGTFTNNAGGGVTRFFGTSTASSAMITNNGGTGGAVSGGETFFGDTSTAANATFINSGIIIFTGASNAGNGTFTTSNGAGVDFSETSSAASGTFTNFGAGSVYGPGSFTSFAGFSSAGNGTFTCEAGGAMDVQGGGVSFTQGTTAANATLIANGGSNGARGGSILFYRGSSGGQARVKVFGNGTGDYTDGYLQLFESVTIGSLEGTGSVFLNRPMSRTSKRLTVGSNNLSTTFSGVIVGSTGFDSLRKIGKGTLTLSHSSGNTYTGGTTINKGTLIAANTTGSATGSGPVQVNSGTLSGTGTINGAVTVGNGTRTGANLQPGVGPTAGTLTINNTVTFNPPSAFKCNVNRATTPLASKLKALGVTIGTNVSFKLLETGTTTLTPGTVFTVINNTSANPISGTFSNLPDGGTIMSANDTVYKANYSGGDGNNLTLTVQ